MPTKMNFIHRITNALLHPFRNLGNYESPLGADVLSFHNAVI
jgi:hypothetical protein